MFCPLSNCLFDLFLKFEFKISTEWVCIINRGATSVSEIRLLTILFGPSLNIKPDVVKSIIFGLNIVDNNLKLQLIKL